MHSHGGHEHHHSHTHVEIAADAAIADNEKGIRAVKLSFAGLFATAVLQLVVVYFTGSVALLADTVHNIGDAATAIPLGIAFALGKWKPSKRFTYGYGRVEDLAGIAVVLVILASAVFAAYAAVDRFFHPQAIEYLWAVALASAIGFAGNEAVAVFRIRTGKEIGSAALVADGYHARIDGLTSLAVLLGVIGVRLGFPLADPLIGAVISIMILRIVWDSSKQVFARALDGVDPHVLDEIRHAIAHVPGVRDITEVRVRWLGHRLHAEVNIAVDSNLPVKEGHEIAKEARHQLLHHLKYLSNATIHVDPVEASGEAFHAVQAHSHGTSSAHSHQ